MEVEMENFDVFILPVGGNVPMKVYDTCINIFINKVTEFTSF